MVESVLTNYNKKFIKEQLDYENISKSKFSYKIYNNKISEPLHKFWFSIPNVKYYNNYSEYLTIRFLMNNKNEKTSLLITYIKDLCNYLLQIFEKEFPNIDINYPWKESEQFPYIFSMFTNNNTLILDSNSNIIDYTKLLYSDTCSIIFEISNIKIIVNDINENQLQTYSLKINLSIILIKLNEKIDLKKYNFLNDEVITDIPNSNNINLNPKSSFPFLKDILGFEKKNDLSVNKNMPTNNSNQNSNSSNLLVINQEQLLKIKNTLKKVNENNIDNNLNIFDSNNKIKHTYLDQKNKLNKVFTDEKSLLTHLKIEEENKNDNKVQDNYKKDKKDIKDKKDKKDKKNKKDKKDKKDNKDNKDKKDKKNKKEEEEEL